MIGGLKFDAGMSEARDDCDEDLCMGSSEEELNRFDDEELRAKILAGELEIELSEKRAPFDFMCWFSIGGED